MTDDPLSRLAAVDPAHDVDPAPREDLLAWTLARPRPTTTPSREPRPRATHRHWRPLLLATSIGACLAGGLWAAHGTGSLDLAAEAYAQTAAGPQQIIHTVVTSTTVQDPPVDGKGRFESRLEEWHRGRETHRVETIRGLDPSGRRFATDHLVDDDGIMRMVTGEGAYRIVRPTDNEDSAEVIARQSSGFVQEFREAYEKRELLETGDAQFAGRPARKLVVKRTNGPRSPRVPDVTTFYLDRETGAPLGMTNVVELNIGLGDGQASKRTINRYTQTVRLIERLDPTPVNLAKLRTAALPRRRDAKGCIRGPAVRAQSWSQVSRRDCGGTPGGSIREP